MLTIQCDEHRDYTGRTKPDYNCPACQCLRALVLESAPVVASEYFTEALVCGLLRVADQPAPTETGPQGAPEVDDHDCRPGCVECDAHTSGVEK